MGLVTALAIGATVAGSALAASSQKKAASKAADTATQTADKNNALTREIYGQNKQMLDPYVQRANVAGAALNDFYGLTQPAPQPAPNATTQWQGYNPDSTGGTFGMADISPDIPGVQTGTGVPGQFTMPGIISGYGGGTWNADGSPATPTPNGSMNPLPGSSSADAFKRYIENSDYAFRFGEGANDINSGYAGAGLLQSGAAMKDMERFRQNLQSGYRNEWAGGVANQQGVGLAGASALAGVGQNYVNTVSQNNNNAASAVGNAALIRGANNPFASALGALGGGILGGGFGK